MNWLVIVDNAVVLETTNESIARERAEEVALAGGAATLAREEGKCEPAPKAASWTK